MRLIFVSMRRIKQYSSTSTVVLPTWGRVVRSLVLIILILTVSSLLVTSHTPPALAQTNTIAAVAASSNSGATLLLAYEIKLRIAQSASEAGKTRVQRTSQDWHNEFRIDNKPAFGKNLAPQANGSSSSGNGGNSLNSATTSSTSSTTTTSSSSTYYMLYRGVWLLPTSGGSGEQNSSSTTSGQTQTLNGQLVLFDQDSVIVGSMPLSFSIPPAPASTATTAASSPNNNSAATTYRASSYQFSGSFVWGGSGSSGESVGAELERSSVQLKPGLPAWATDLARQLQVQGSVGGVNGQNQSPQPANNPNVAASSSPTGSGTVIKTEAEQEATSSSSTSSTGRRSTAGNPLALGLIAFVFLGLGLTLVWHGMGVGLFGRGLTRLAHPHLVLLGGRPTAKSVTTTNTGTDDSVGQKSKVKSKATTVKTPKPKRWGRKGKEKGVVLIETDTHQAQTDMAIEGGAAATKKEELEPQETDNHHDEALVEAEAGAGAGTGTGTGNGLAEL